MSVVQMRTALKERTKYRHSPKWIDRVNKMSDRQIMAIYFRMLREGELL